MPCNIINQSVDSLTGLKKMAGTFFPYAEQQLGFDQPVDIIFQSDSENAQNILGKTAQYDPDGMSVTLFTDGRHPKDVLRSLSHELVHHAQNCRGEFDSIGDTSLGYAQKDGHLRGMEEEAYKLGNLIFRDWEDMFKQKVTQLQERKIRKTLKKGLRTMLNEVTAKVGGNAQVRDLEGQKILLVGDSHMKGPIGKNLEKMLRARGATVVRAAQTSSRSWYWNDNVFGGKKYTGKMTKRRGWDSEGDREKLYRHKYDKIIVSFGGNESPDQRKFAGFIRNWKGQKKARPGETDAARIKRLIPVYEHFRQERIIPFMKNLQSLGAPIEFFGLPPSKKKEAGRTPNPVGRGLINGAYKETARELGIRFHNMDNTIDDNPEFAKLKGNFGLAPDGSHYRHKAGKLYAKDVLSKAFSRPGEPLYIRDPETYEPVIDPSTGKKMPYAYVPTQADREAQWLRDQKASVASEYEHYHVEPTYWGPEKLPASAYTDQRTLDHEKGPWGRDPGRWIKGSNPEETSRMLKQYLEDLKDIEVTTDAYNSPWARPISSGIFGHKGHPKNLLKTAWLPAAEWLALGGAALAAPVPAVAAMAGYGIGKAADWAAENAPIRWPWKSVKDPIAAGGQIAKDPTTDWGEAQSLEAALMRDRRRQEKQHGSQHYPRLPLDKAYGGDSSRVRELRRQEREVARQKRIDTYQLTPQEIKILDSADNHAAAFEQIKQNRGQVNVENK